MRRMLHGNLQVEAASFTPVSERKYSKEGTFTSINEPISVLDTIINSPSPSTSTAGSGGGGGEVKPILGGPEVGPGGFEKFGPILEDLDSLLYECVQDQSLLGLITGDAVDDTPFSLKQWLHGGIGNEIDGNNASLGIIDPSFGFEIASGNNNGINGLVPNCLGLNNNCGPQKVQSFDPQMMISQPQVQGISMLSHPLMNCAQQDQINLFQPQPKFQNIGFANSSPQIPKVAFNDQGHEFWLQKQHHLPQIPQSVMGLAQQPNLLPEYLQQKPFIVPKQEALPHHQQQQVIYDQLYKAAELILVGNFSHAQEILARLNHHISPIGKPFQRAAYYFKEALQLALLLPNPTNALPPRIPTPFDGMLKMSAYKVFSEISPFVHFMNFTSNQVLLEGLGNAENIHIIDFDIGFGAQWSSFMQELLLTRKNNAAPSLKITAFASPSSHHHVELGLMHENLTQFANDIGVNFQLQVFNLDTFDLNCCLMSSFRSSENEAIGVNFPVWSTYSHLSVLPSILCFLKQLSPKIMVSLDHGCGRTELPFPHHLLHALQYYEVLLDSIDAANVTSDTTNKIERFLFQPRIESLVLGRLQTPNQMPSWKSLFASVGFSPVAISNFAETQAEYVVKGTQATGFHVEMCQALLVLLWQHRELVSASAWR